MPTIHELDLETLPIASEQFGYNPLPHFEAARGKHDWLAASDIGYVLTRYRANEDILRMDDKLKMPGEEIHRRHRRPVPAGQGGHRARCIRTKPEELGYDGDLMTVTRIVNAIPCVCAAAPGLTSFRELPMTTPTSAFRSDATSIKHRILAP